MKAQHPNMHEMNGRRVGEMDENHDTYGPDLKDHQSIQLQINYKLQTNVRRRLGEQTENQA